MRTFKNLKSIVIMKCLQTIVLCKLIADTMQVLETICELTQTYQTFFMKFWYIIHYTASFGDDLNAKMN